MDDHNTTPNNTGTGDDENTYPEIMNSEQAMSFLQIGRSAFYKAMRAGEIPCRRIGSKLIRFHRETLSTWIAGGPIPAAAAHAPPPLLKNDLQQAPATPRKPESRRHAITGEIVTDAGRIPGRRLSQEQRDIAKRAYLADVNCGGVLKDAARDAGVTMGTVRAWRDTDPDFKEVEQAFRINDIETYT